MDLPAAGYVPQVSSPRRAGLAAGLHRHAVRTARGPVPTVQAGPSGGRLLVYVGDGPGGLPAPLDLLAHLAHQGRRVVALDPSVTPRGFDSDRPEHRSPDHRVADLLALIDALGGRADLVDGSSDGMVAATVATDRPHAVVSLTRLTAEGDASPSARHSRTAPTLADRPVPVLVLAAASGDGGPGGDPHEVATRLGAFLDAWAPPVVLLDLAVADDTHEVPAARRRLRALAEQGRLPAAVLDDLEVVVSELLTNALLHGSPPVRLHLQVRRTPAPVVEIDVRDAGRGCTDAGREPGRPDHGRGVALVAALSRRSGCYLGSDGCHAWAQLSPA